MNYVVIRSMKNKGLAFLLTTLFGPIGLCYSSIMGGVIMALIAPIAVLVFKLHIGFGFTLISYFSSSSMGEVIMIIFSPIGTFYSLFAFGSEQFNTEIFFYCIYYIACIVWTLIAVEKYNNKILLESEYYNSNNSNYETTNVVNADLSVTDEIANKKSQLFQDLVTLKSLFDTDVINQVEYEKRKSIILNKIELLEHNDTSKYNSIANTYGEIQNSSPSIFNGRVLILASIIIALLAFILYDTKTKSLNFDKITNLFSANSKEKKEVATQLEKAYFDVTNGKIGDEMPFYNSNIGSLLLTGFVTLVKYESNVRIEPTNIDVYELSDDKKSGKVRYDLTILKGTDSIKASIDMDIKKVGNLWKFDAEKFFQFDLKKKENKKKTTALAESKSINNYSTNAQQNNEVSSATFLNEKAQFYTVKNIVNKDNNGELMLTDFNGDRNFIITATKIFEVNNGVITNTWHIKDIVDDGVDIFIYKTKENLDIFFQDFLSVTYPNGTNISYKVDSAGKESLNLK